MTRVQITEYLDIDLDTETWVCERCDEEITDATENYKKGCLIDERDPTEVHKPEIDKEYTFAPDPEWCRIVEFYCPGCGTMLENEYLPPGHPITHDIEPDLTSLRQRVAREES